MCATLTLNPLGSPLEHGVHPVRPALPHEGRWLGVHAGSLRSLCKAQGGLSQGGGRAGLAWQGLCGRVTGALCLPAACTQVDHELSVPAVRVMLLAIVAYVAAVGSGLLLAERQASGVPASLLQFTAADLPSQFLHTQGAASLSLTGSCCVLPSCMQIKIETMIQMRSIAVGITIIVFFLVGGRSATCSRLYVPGVMCCGITHTLAWCCHAGRDLDHLMAECLVHDLCKRMCSFVHPATQKQEQHMNGQATSALTQQIWVVHVLPHHQASGNTRGSPPLHAY